jgi:dihydroneopterin aldolase/2-amino-4-hydroxy-6-hydroxymethyldihydropteridine diphosphokinase
MKNSDYRVIRIRELEVFAYHGVFEDETKNGQKFYINAELKLETRKQDVTTDDLNCTVNYAEVCQFMTKFMKENTCKLIEKIAELLCREILIRYPLINEVVLEIRKPEAPIGLPFESVSVERKLSRHTAFLSIGSNMGDKHGYLDRALEMIGRSPHTRFICESERFVTKPYGGVEQDDFVNSAVMIETFLSPFELLDFLHEVEKEQGRVRTIHWGPRTLDLDIIFYDDITVSESDLIIPHIDMQNRLFVLEPLSKIAGYYRHPVLNKTVAELYEELKAREEM